MILSHHKLKSQDWPRPVTRLSADPDSGVVCHFYAAFQYMHGQQEIMHAAWIDEAPSSISWPVSWGLSG